MRTGRPRERAITLMDGFYIEISNKGESKGLKIEARQGLRWSFPQNNTQSTRM